MNLYEWEGKALFAKYGIAVPKGIVVRRADDAAAAYRTLGVREVVAKAQILSGKRGKSGGVVFCSSDDEVRRATDALFSKDLNGQYVAAVLIEEKLPVAEEHYLSITYDTNAKTPVLVRSARGGMDIEEVSDEFIERRPLDVRDEQSDEPLWRCFRAEDARVVEINPFVKTTDGRWVAADAKVALDDDAFFRHPEWKDYEPRTVMGRLPTEREIAVKKIDEGENYYRGTAGKYIEMDGEVATLFAGGGASIANMDALIATGLRPANYSEFSGNPPREKVRDLTRIVLSKPGLRGLWIVGGVANFTDVAETFAGIVDVLDEIKPSYPIVVRRAGPRDAEGMEIMRACGERNHLAMKLFGKETSMNESAKTLASHVNSH